MSWGGYDEQVSPQKGLGWLMDRFRDWRTCTHPNFDWLTADRCRDCDLTSLEIQNRRRMECTICGLHLLASTRGARPLLWGDGNGGRYCSEEHCKLAIAQCANDPSLHVCASCAAGAHGPQPEVECELVATASGDMWLCWECASEARSQPVRRFCGDCDHELFGKFLHTAMSDADVTRCTQRGWTNLMLCGECWLKHDLQANSNRDCPKRHGPLRPAEVEESAWSRPHAEEP